MERGEMMEIHSKILVHWTGEDIENCPEDDKSRLYVERLKDDLENGLFTKRTDEATIRGYVLKDFVRICFTEIRLSQAQTHAGRYGKLGIGFARDFIMNNGGRPVIYIPFKAEPSSRLLENSLRSLHEDSKGYAELHRSARWVLAHVKRMSNGKGVKFFEEMEWRIVCDQRADNEHFTKGEGKGVYRFEFHANDVEVIIFPDEPTKRLFLEDEAAIKTRFSEHIPIMATLDDCRNF